MRANEWTPALTECTTQTQCNAMHKRTILFSHRMPSDVPEVVSYTAAAAAASIRMSRF